jgi:ABC-type sugar transport system permease subunit
VDEAKGFRERLPFFWALLFQIINLILYLYTLGLEGKSKINSLQIYTTWYFFPMAVLHLVTGTMFLFYFPPDMVYFIIIQESHSICRIHSDNSRPYPISSDSDPRILLEKLRLSVPGGQPGVDDFTAIEA